MPLQISTKLLVMKERIAAAPSAAFEVRSVRGNKRHSPGGAGAGAGARLPEPTTDKAAWD